MNVLSIENVGKSYGARKLFKGLTFGLNLGEKAALVANNGAGKSTLLKVLMGVEKPDEGIIAFKRDAHVVFLEQEPQLYEGNTVLNELFEGKSPALNAIRDYENALLAMEHEYNDSTAKALQLAQTQMDNLGAWDYETKAKQILSVLGISYVEQTIDNLSGGQRKRVALAKALIQQPDLLIMDEPTNHLDMEMVQWLEGYLSSSDMALLLVTHDRYFLDRVCDTILEMENGQLYRHQGNYSYYVEKKAEREAQQMAETDKARNLYRKELEWVRRMPKARTTKSKARVDAFDDIKERAMQRKVQNTISLSVKTERMGAKILEAHQLKKSYEDLQILNNFNHIFQKGEKVGIVGKNGIGKSTFLNILMGLEPLDGGKVVHGETMVFGYFTQNSAALPDGKRVIEVIKDIAEFIPMANGTKLSASQLLTLFLFTPETQYNYVSVLSGGERRRLQLLMVLIKNPNFLVLDEPTNDLDIATLSVLEDFLSNFAGCVIVVSHDRYFMDKIVDHLFVFEGDGVIKDFPGNVSDYLDWKELDKMEKKADNVPVKKIIEKVEKKADKPTPSPVNAPVKKKLSYKEQKEYDTLEGEIAEMENKRKAISSEMNSGQIASHELLNQLATEYQNLGTAIEEKTMRWLELADM